MSGPIPFDAYKATWAVGGHVAIYPVDKKHGFERFSFTDMQLEALIDTAIKGAIAATRKAIESSPAPVQPDMGNHISENIAAALLTAHGVCPHSTGTPAWAQWLADAVAGVQLQAEPVAVAVPCDYATRDGRLNGVNVTLVLLGNDKEIAAGEIALYLGAAPVAQADKLDAERYRWLRSTTQRIVNRHGDKVDVTPEIMDSTIDDNILAAMKGTP